MSLVGIGGNSVKRRVRIS